MIVLASASPRRRDLLREAGLDFQVDPADVDESLEAGLDPVTAAVVLAERKARAVLTRHGGAGALLIGADTIVALPQEGEAWSLLGKPADAPEAHAMLSSLGGSRHAVVTGVAVARAEDGSVTSHAETTWVTMRPILPEEVEGYVASGEWRDKAGGYAIQETADRFVTSLEGGGFDNVVGLPVRRTLELLAASGSSQAARLLAAGGG